MRKRTGKNEKESAGHEGRKKRLHIIHEDGGRRRRRRYHVGIIIIIIIAVAMIGPEINLVRERERRETTIPPHLALPCHVL